MLDLLIQNMDAALHQRLSRLARGQGKSLSEFACELLVLADRARNYLQVIPDQSTRDIRRSRDGGCGFCDELELLVGLRKVSPVSQPQ